MGERRPVGEPHAEERRDLTTFAQLLAVRYDGENPGVGSVDLWSVWNEPNLQQFLTPQYVGKKIVSPTNYAKLFKAAYAGIKAGNPAAKVAIGETSAQGRDKPAAGESPTVSPGMFAQLLARPGPEVRRLGASSVSDVAEVPPSRRCASRTSRSRRCRRSRSI